MHLAALASKAKFLHGQQWPVEALRVWEAACRRARRLELHAELCSLLELQPHADAWPKVVLVAKRAAQVARAPAR
eukprot:4898894-Alexandrium_andersonii.AAC.1